eukprot:7108789-Prymnesium_polylepis.2
MRAPSRHCSCGGRPPRTASAHAHWNRLRVERGASNLGGLTEGVERRVLDCVTAEPPDGVEPGRCGCERGLIPPRIPNSPRAKREILRGMKKRRPRCDPQLAVPPQPHVLVMLQDICAVSEGEA